MTGEYPRATDTFIQREIAALRKLGMPIKTFSVRRTDDTEIVGHEQQEERKQTFYILSAMKAPVLLLKTHTSLLARSPLRYLSALRLAIRTRYPGIRGLIYQLFYFAEAGVVVQRMRKERLNHLHNHFGDSSCSLAMIASDMGNFSFSFTLHGPAIFFEPMRWRLDEKIKRAKFVCCISNFCRSQAMIFSNPDNWKKLYIIHCGVSPALFNMVSHSGVGRRLLHIGRLATAKGLPVLFDAMLQVIQQVPKAKLRIIGDGPDRLWLENRVQDLGLSNNIEFVGYKSQEEVRQELLKADCFVTSSFAEGVPVVLMEAMAAGLPVIATQIAGISELVEDSVNGYLTPPGDVDTLTNCIIRLIENHDLRQNLGTMARKKVEAGFDIDKEALRLFKVFSSEVKK